MQIRKVILGLAAPLPPGGSEGRLSSPCAPQNHKVRHLLISWWSLLAVQSWSRRKSTGRCPAILRRITPTALLPRSSVSAVGRSLTSSCTSTGLRMQGRAWPSWQKRVTAPGPPRPLRRELAATGSTIGRGTVLGQEAYQLWAVLRPSNGLPLRGIPRPACRSLRWAGTIRSHPLLGMDASHPRSPLDTTVPIHGPFEPSGESPSRPAAWCRKDGEASLAGGREASLPTENRLGHQLDLDGA